MTRHRCGVWLLIFGVVLWSGIARAQQAPSIPAEARTAPNIGPFQKQIDAFIDAQVQLLEGEDDLAHQQARDALVNAVRPQGATQPGPVYLHAFNRSLNRGLTAMSKEAPLRGRLNAAIALTRVAESVQSQANSQLVAAVVRFIQDPDLPVALWGMKAAEEVVPYELLEPLVTKPENSKILAAIRPVLETHDSGALYEEAYYATSLKVADQTANVEPKAVRIAVPITQDIFADRVKAMQAEPIDGPHAEMRAMFFLANPRAYPTETPEQRLRTAQLIADFTALLAQRLAANPEDAPQVLPIIRYAGSNIANIGQIESTTSGNNAANQAIRSAGEQLGRIEDNVAPARVQQMVEDLYETLKAVPTFATLQTQPQINTSPASGEAGNAGTIAAQVQE